MTAEKPEPTERAQYDADADLDAFHDSILIRWRETRAALTYWQMVTTTVSPSQMRYLWTWRTVSNLIQMDVEQGRPGALFFTLTQWRPRALDFPRVESELSDDVIRTNERFIERARQSHKPAMQLYRWVRGWLVDRWKARVRPQPQSTPAVPEPARPRGLHPGRPGSKLYDQVYDRLYVGKIYASRRAAFEAEILPTLKNMDASSEQTAYNNFDSAMDRRMPKQ